MTRNKFTTRRAILAGVGLTIVLLSVFGCSAKAREQFNDAPRGTVNEQPADGMAFPDGFSNVSHKCDGQNMVYVAYHGDSPYAAIAVAPNDPRCTK